MKGLRVLDKDGKALSIKQIDAEICELIGNEVDSKWYSVMVNRKEFRKNYIEKNNIKSSELFDAEIAEARLPNWFDTIGYMCSNENKTLDEVVEFYRKGMEKFLGKPLKNGEIVTLEMIYPGELKVINYFKEQGYTLIGVE